MNKNNITVIGAGSWGTALALLLAKKGYEVRLWGHRREHIFMLEEDRENKKYLKGFKFPENLKPTQDLRKCIEGVSVVCMVVPSHGFRIIFEEVRKYLQGAAIIVSATKGIENQSQKTMTQVMEGSLQRQKNNSDIRLAVLSGPSFAQEVACEMPTAITVGCNEQAVAEQLQHLFSTDYFRVYTSQDVLGLEISASMKNIIALAAGICDGLGYGTNSRAALITRGLAEMTRLGVKMGADVRTFYGLSGLGDLVLTCTGDLSRNRYVGIQLGKGKKLEDILNKMSMVAEGVKTTKSIYDLKKKMNIEMPILDQVYQIIYEGKDRREAVKELLTRDLKAE